MISRLNLCCPSHSLSVHGLIHELDESGYLILAGGSWSEAQLVRGDETTIVVVELLLDSIEDDSFDQLGCGRDDTYRSHFV